MKISFSQILDVLDNEDHVRVLLLDSRIVADAHLQPVHLHQRTGLFAALPARAQYADYYAIIKNPIVRQTRSESFDRF